MRSLATGVSSERHDLLDTSGTGGGRRTFNVSTTAALIAAGAGCALAKHGNRSATSSSGSADVLEALGARIDLDPEGVARCISEAGFGFMFAPAHHQATRFVIPVRRELAVRTIFNLLGPLTNPAGASRQLIGVFDPAFLERIAGALARLGTVRALVVSSEDGLDEISICAATHVAEVNGQDITHYTLTPEDVGVKLAPPSVLEEELAGGTPQQNAAITRAILAGEPGHRREMAVVNAAGAIYAAGAAESLTEGVQMARASIADASAMQVLERYIQTSVSWAEGRER
jgi:anthranilate phosphoribosyltransferase